MSPNLIVWLLLGLSVLGQVIGAAIAGQNDRLIAEVRVAHRARASTPAVVLLALVGLANVTFWTLYAIAVHDWRFAAISAIPVVTSWIVKLATSAKNSGTEAR